MGVKQSQSSKKSQSSVYMHAPSTDRILALSKQPAQVSSESARSIGSSALCSNPGYPYLPFCYLLEVVKSGSVLGLHSYAIQQDATRHFGDAVGPTSERRGFLVLSQVQSARNRAVEMLKDDDMGSGVGGDCGQPEAANSPVVAGLSQMEMWTTCDWVEIG